MKIVITDKSGQVLYDGSPDLHSDGIVIGSAPTCDIRLNKIGIAAAHAQLRYNADGVLTLQDLQSPMGTLVDGVRLQPGFITAIKPGAFLELSEEVFVTLQPEADDIYLANSGNKLFPFFLNSNENFVRKLFGAIRARLPREHYQSISAAEGEIVTRIKELAAVSEVAGALNSFTSLPRLLDFSLEMAIAVTGAERAMLLLYNENLKRLETMATSNFMPSDLAEDMLSVGTFVNKCFEEGKALTGSSHLFKSLATRRTKSLEESGIAAVAAVPLKELGTDIGVLYVDTKKFNNVMSGRTDELLKILASQIAIAINRTKMFHEATTDTVTGVANQNLFLRRLSEEFCRAQRHQKDISLILMDIDHLKSISETYEENVANCILKEVGKIFRSATRIHDVVARVGAETFAMILPETPYTGALVVAEKLRTNLGKTIIRIEGHSIQVTGSFGIGSSSATTFKPADLLKASEKALKLARKRGGNQIA